MPESPKKIFVIAGEASGDLHGANLIRALRSESPSAKIYGAGGDKIRETGALEFFDLARFHVTGFSEAIRSIPLYRKAAKSILSTIEKTAPDLVTLIDNPGFNLHLAKKIHALKIPIVYYIPPQLWAWAPKRILKIKKYIAKVLVVFQFEEKLYRDHAIPVAWVGHPLKDLIKPQLSSSPAHRSNRQIALLPGSRKGELKMLLSVFLKAAAIISEGLPGISFALIKSPTLPKDFYDAPLRGQSLNIHLVEENSYVAIRQSELAIVCSGTATLECALLGTPMIVSNRVSYLNYLLIKQLIRVPYIGLPNVILGEKKIPELLQQDATPEKIALKALRILKNPALQKQMKADLEEVSRKVGEPGASQRAAREILDLVQSIRTTA